MQKLLTIFSKNISVYAIFNDQNDNEMLTNNIVSFEQLGLGSFEQVIDKWGDSKSNQNNLLHQY